MRLDRCLKADLSIHPWLQGRKFGYQNIKQTRFTISWLFHDGSFRKYQFTFTLTLLQPDEPRKYTSRFEVQPNTINVIAYAEFESVLKIIFFSHQAADSRLERLICNKRPAIEHTWNTTLAINCGCGCWLYKNSPITLFMTSCAGKKSTRNGGRIRVMILASYGIPFRILRKSGHRWMI